MTETITVNSEVALAEAQRQLAQMWRNNKHVEVDIRRKAKQRTLTQNRALHMWCQWLADELNAAGFDMRRTLRQDVEVPWSGETVKEHLWKPVQEALLQKRSTTEADRNEYTEVHEVLSRHLGQKLGIQAPEWPRREKEAA